MPGSGRDNAVEEGLQRRYGIRRRQGRQRTFGEGKESWGLEKEFGGMGGAFVLRRAVTKVGVGVGVGVALGMREMGARKPVQQKPSITSTARHKGLSLTLLTISLSRQGTPYAAAGTNQRAWSSTATEQES